MVGAKRQGFNRGFGFFTAAADTAAASNIYKPFLHWTPSQLDTPMQSWVTPIIIQGIWILYCSGRYCCCIGNIQTLLALDTLPVGHPYAIMGQTDHYVRAISQTDKSDQ